MTRVVRVNKTTGEEVFLEEFEMVSQAERFCEEWGWTYSDGRDDYWLQIYE